MNTATSQVKINPRLLLQRELERRCQANPRYSLRAFARALSISPTVLSLVLSGKRLLSANVARSVAQQLPLSEDECASLLAWADTQAERRKNRREPARPDDGPSPHQMSVDSFAMVSDWHHLAILSLLEIPGARFEARWIARQLGVTEIEAKSAMERLSRMGLIEERDGRWRQATGPIRMANVPTSATRKFQKQLLLKAVESLENEPVDNRDFSSMTLAMSAEQVPYARERIREFRRQLTRELEAQGKPERVYELTVQIFPVSRPVPNPKEFQ